MDEQMEEGPVGHYKENVPYTPRVKKVLELALVESVRLQCKRLGTEHLLLGLLREGGGIAGHVLKNLDIDIEQTRQEVCKKSGKL